MRWILEVLRVLTHAKNSCMSIEGCALQAGECCVVQDANAQQESHVNGQSSVLQLTEQRSSQSSVLHLQQQPSSILPGSTAVHCFP